MLTGSDRVKARFVRQDFFEFVPQLKLFIIGNHKPSLRSVDEAMRRRFNLIPFAVTIPAEERDAELSAKLKAESPGILAWMIDGCLEWQAMGLQAPAAVTAATAKYLEAEDAVAAWMDECCERSPNAWERSTELFGSWTAWAERFGEYKRIHKLFRQKLESIGIFHRREFGTGRTGYQGVRLREGVL